MVYNNNNRTGPLVLTTNNHPNLWRTNSYIKRRNERRKAAQTRKNWFSKLGSMFKKKNNAAKTRRARR